MGKFSSIFRYPTTSNQDIINMKVVQMILCFLFVSYCYGQGTLGIVAGIQFNRISLLNENSFLDLGFFDEGISNIFGIYGQVDFAESNNTRIGIKSQLYWDRKSMHDTEQYKKHFGINSRAIRMDYIGMDAGPNLAVFKKNNFQFSFEILFGMHILTNQVVFIQFIEENQPSKYAFSEKLINKITGNVNVALGPEFKLGKNWIAAKIFFNSLSKNILNQYSHFNSGNWNSLGIKVEYSIIRTEKPIKNN